MKYRKTSPFTIDGGPFAFLAWGNEHRSCYVLSGSQELVVELELPCLRQTAWSQDFRFSSARPTEIAPAHLVPPPCAASKADVSVLLAVIRCGPVFEPESIPDEVLYPIPADDAEIQQRLDVFRAARKTEESDRLNQIAKVHAKNKRDLELARRITHEEFHGNSDHPTRDAAHALYHKVGALNITLEIEKATNAAHIRDPYLVERWAREKGYDLKVMERERGAFLKLAREYLVQKHGVRGESSPPAANLSLDSERGAALAARVRRVIRCNDGRSFYLAGFRLRDHLTPAEARDFEALRVNNAPEATVVISGAQQETTQLPDAQRSGEGRDGEVGASAKGTVSHGRLECRSGFKDVWLGGKHYDLSHRVLARLCIHYLYEEKAFDEKSAKNFLEEIDPYVRARGRYKKSETTTIHGYFNDSKRGLPKLYKELIRSVGKTGCFFLKTD